MSEPSLRSTATWQEHVEDGIWQAIASADGVEAADAWQREAQRLREEYARVSAVEADRLRAEWQRTYGRGGGDV